MHRHEQGNRGDIHVTRLSSSERKTKIVCTIGPATSSEPELRALLQAGMNVARLNFSHGSHAEHGLLIARIRHLASELGVTVAILQDLAGPKVRIGTFAEATVTLRAGDLFTLTTRAVEGNRHEVSVSYPCLPQEVKAGDRVLLADGRIELHVQQVTEEDILCQVTVGGSLSDRKGVNCPSGLFGLPIFRDEDLHDLRFGVEQAVDYVGLSFVRTADDVRTAKREVAKLGGDVPIIAKIETEAAVRHFDEILTEADGIMVARGDLAIETPFARVPVVQKLLIAKANQQGKPVITATQMLFSMVHAPHPTRAEVADVANAILDGSDAVMLSEETAVGEHPATAVRTMAAIAAGTERAGLQGTLQQGRGGHPAREADPAVPTGTDAMAQAACQVADRLQVEAIATVTLTGLTARFVAKYRPPQPILAATPRPETYRRLALIRGVIPVLLPGTARSRYEMMRAAEVVVRERGWQGKRAVIVSSTAADRHLLTTDVL
jgi:pyruvate kinase